MPSRKLLLVLTIISVFTIAFIACTKNWSAGRDRETTRQPLKSNASKDEVPNLAADLDGPISIFYFEIFKYGSTTWSSFARNSMNVLPPLPTGYEPISGLVYRLESEAVVSGPNLTTFQVPSIREQTTFETLAILHLEFNELDPYMWAWVDSTVLPFKWSPEYYPQISKESFDKASPDFSNKRVSAIHEKLGIFVLAHTVPLPLQSDRPFTNIEMSTTGSPARVPIGDNVTYTITVKNKGPQPAGDVNLKNQLDIDIDFISATPSQGTCKESQQSDGRIICHLGALQVGANVSITIVGKVRYDDAMDTRGPRLRSNTTFLVFKERAPDMANHLNMASNKISTLTLPRSNQQK